MRIETKFYEGANKEFVIRRSHQLLSKADGRYFQPLYHSMPKLSYCVETTLSVKAFGIGLYLELGHLR
jgi:hypothetical protein